MIEKLIQKSHGAGIGGVSSLVHKLVKLNPIKQTRNELKLGVVKLAQAFTTNDLRANEGRETKALNCKPITNLKEISELSNYCKPAVFVCTLLLAGRSLCI
jgi:hypothetical protein